MMQTKFIIILQIFILEIYIEMTHCLCQTSYGACATNDDCCKEYICDLMVFQDRWSCRPLQPEEASPELTLRHVGGLVKNKKEHPQPSEKERKDWFEKQINRQRLANEKWKNTQKRKKLVPAKKQHMELQAAKEKQKKD